MNELTHKEFLKEFGVRLRIAMEIKGFSRLVVNDKTSINRNTIGQILDGKSNFSIQSFQSLMNLFEVNPIIFFIDSKELKRLYEELKSLLPNMMLEKTSLDKLKEMKETLNTGLNDIQDYVKFLQKLVKIRIKNIPFRKNHKNYIIKNQRAANICGCIALHMWSDVGAIEIGVYLGNLLYKPVTPRVRNFNAKIRINTNK